MSVRSVELLKESYTKEQLARQVWLLELSQSSLQKALRRAKELRRGTMKRNKKLQARVAELLNQNHRLEDRLRPLGLSSGGILSRRNHETKGDGE